MLYIVSYTLIHETLKIFNFV